MNDEGKFSCAEALAKERLNQKFEKMDHFTIKATEQCQDE